MMHLFYFTFCSQCCHDIFKYAPNIIGRKATAAPGGDFLVRRPLGIIPNGVGCHQHDSYEDFASSQNSYTLFNVSF